MNGSLVRQRHSGRRLALAFVIAATADVLSVALTIAAPLQLVVDLVTALLLFTMLGRQWMLLPGLVLEAIPGIAVVPFWFIVVGTIATLGSVRPGLTGSSKPESAEYSR